MEKIMYKWACERLSDEIKNDFTNISKFNYFVSRVNILALQTFSNDEKQVLCNLLPLGILYDINDDARLISSFDHNQTNLIKEIIQRRDELINFNSGESLLYAKNVVSIKNKPLSKLISKKLLKQSRLHALKYDSNAKIFDGNTVEFKISNEKYTFSITFGVQLMFSLSYQFDVMKNNNIVLSRTSYLYELGLGSSCIYCKSLEEVDIVVESALDFILWHISVFPEI